MAKDEIRLLLEVRQHHDEEGLLGVDRVVQLLDHFQITGPFGTHQCMVFDVLGVNLLKIIAETDYKGLPLTQVHTIFFSLFFTNKNPSLSESTPQYFMFPKFL